MDRSKVSDDRRPIIDHQSAKPSARKVCQRPPKLERRHWIVLTLLFLLPLADIMRAILTDDLAEYRFVVPLTGGYYLQRFDLGSLPPDMQRVGPYQIFHSTPAGMLAWDPETGWPNSQPSSQFVPNVQRLALIPGRSIIVGLTSSDCFELDANSANLQVFDTASKLSAAMQAIGAGDVPLLDPMAIARALPRQTIRPWAYQQMGGWLGLSDVAWNLIFEDVGGMIALLAGLAVPRIYSWRSRITRRVAVLLFALSLGIVVNCIANGWLLDGGPDAFVGMFSLPIGYMVAATLGAAMPFWVCSLFDHLFPRRKRSDFRLVIPSS